MPRTSIAPAIRPSRTRVLTGGNGSPEPTNRLAQIEALLERLGQRIDVQFQRTAEIQAQLDRLVAKVAGRDDGV